MDINPPLLEKKKRKKQSLFRIVSQMDDASLAERSRTWHALYLEHQSEFEVLDPRLTVAFGNDWLAKIEAFESIQKDKTVEDGLQQKTVEVAEATDAQMKKVDDLQYFAERAFPDDERVMMEFGFEQIRKQNQSSTPRIIVNGWVMRRVADDYTAQLLAVGMPATLPAELNAAIENLEQAELAQEYEKRLRLRTTTLRIRSFNELYRIHQQVRRAADVVFREAPVIAKQFA